MKIHSKNYRAFLTIFLGVWVALTFCKCGNKEQREENNRKFETAYKQKNYQRILQLADSMEADGSISLA